MLNFPIGVVKELLHTYFIAFVLFFVAGFVQNTFFNDNTRENLAGNWLNPSSVTVEEKIWKQARECYAQPYSQVSDECTNFLYWYGKVYSPHHGGTVPGSYKEHLEYVERNKNR